MIKIVMMNRDTVYIDGFKSLFKIAEDKISLYYNNQYLHIIGEGLYIKFLNNHEIMIKGMINTVNWN